MRLLALLVFCVVFLIGCSAVQRQVDFYNACRNDLDCSAKMASAYSVAHSVAMPITSASGLPNVTAEVLSGLVSLLVGLVYGRKTAKRKAGG